MQLTRTTLLDFLAALRSPSPVPGGGSASALTGALGAALLAMVASLPGRRVQSEEDAARLRAAGHRAAGLSERLAALVDLDSEAYAGVMAAYRLPRASDQEKAERGARIQAALKSAAEAPLETMERCRDAIEAAVTVAELGNASAASDVGVALELLAAGLRGARLNVEINLDSLKDTSSAESLRRQSETLAAEIDSGIAAARARLA
jgi:formiminotetrahydrofolate cyclodeaminase